SSRPRQRSACRRRWNCSAWTSRACRTKRDMPERAEGHARAKGTVLAFDFGLKRIGVAVGERELLSAHPLPAVENFDQIGKLVAEWRPAAFVVGLPVAEQGLHPLAKRVERFARQLEGRYRLPVARVDE